MDNILRSVIGLAGLFGAGWSAARVLRMHRHGQEADAVVLESKESVDTGGQGQISRRWVSTVRFQDDLGVERTSRLPGRYEPGEAVVVRYIPGRTERVSPPGKTSFGEAFAILTATAAAIAVTLLL